MAQNGTVPKVPLLLTKPCVIRTDTSSLLTAGNFINCENINMSDVIKLSDGREIAYSKTVRDLVKTCHEIAAKGLDVSASTLKIVAPNHSKRDYSAACDIYRDEVKVRMECSVPMPPNIQELCNNSIRLIWGTVNRHWEAQIANLKEFHQKELENFRKNQEFVHNVNDDLTLQVKNLESEQVRMEAENQKFRDESQAETARLKNECQELKQEKIRLAEDYQDFKESKNSETERLKSEYQKRQENSDAEIARLTAANKELEVKEKQFDRKYQELAKKLEGVKTESASEKERFREEIKDLEKESGRLKESNEALKQEIGVYSSKITSLEELIAEMKTQVHQYSNLYAEMHQLMAPLTAYCLSTSENDSLVREVNDTLNKIRVKAEDMFKAREGISGKENQPSTPQN